MAENASSPANAQKWLAMAAPGLLVVCTIAFAASYLSEHYGAPVMLFALLIGMAFHFLYEDEKCAIGVRFAARHILHIGVALLGLRISLSQVFSLGWPVLGLVISGVLLCIGFGMLAARLANKPTRFGLLTGGAVGICGASAAMAISALLPQNKQSETDTLFTVIAVTTLSSFAMILYPVLGGWFGFSDIQLGILFGATIHDVAQVVGAGYAVSEQTGDIATIVKLIRVAMLVPVLVVISIVAARLWSVEQPGMQKRFPLPWFAVAFAALVAANSLGWVPAAPKEMLIAGSRWCLVIAISALGVMTTLKAMVSLGPKHIAIIVAETLILFGFVIAALKFLI